MYALRQSPASVRKGVSLLLAVARETAAALSLAEKEFRVRKIIEFDDETFTALKLLAGDRMSNLQELADEAFADLLKKHGRPVGLKDALRQSLRRIPANDANKAKSPKGRGRR